MDQRVRHWYLVNIKALMKTYGDLRYDDKHFRWVYIKNYILPKCFNQETSALLLETPGEDLMRPQGFQFFLNKNLRRVDGKPTQRLSDNGSKYSKKGFAWICLYINDFRPRSNPALSDNLIDLCQTLYMFVGDETGIL